MEKIKETIAKIGTFDDGAMKKAKKRVHINSCIKSYVENTLILFCFLNEFSSDQMGQLNFNARAKYCISFGCGDNFSASFAHSLNSSNGIKSIWSLMNLNVSPSTSGDNLLLVTISPKLLPISKNMNSGAINSYLLRKLLDRKISNDPPFDNNAERTSLVSTTNNSLIILIYSDCIDCINLMERFLLILSDNSLISSSVNLLADNFSLNFSILSTSDLSNLLTTRFQFIPENSFISCPNSSGIVTTNSAIVNN